MFHTGKFRALNDPATGKPAQASMITTLNAGEVRPLDNVIASNFPTLTQTAGSLVATART